MNEKIGIILLLIMSMSFVMSGKPAKKMIAANETMTVSNWHSDIPADAELVYVEAISAEQWV